MSEYLYDDMMMCVADPVPYIFVVKFLN